MPAFQINDDEREALRGLPMLAREAYVFGLRPFMDYATGIVGIKRGVSWKSIAEELYVEPHQGIESGEPTEKQLRRAVVWLQKAGLLSENMAERRLVFDLLRASRDQSVRNKEGSKRADQAGRPPTEQNPSVYAASEGVTPSKAAGGEIQKAGTPPVSGNPPTTLCAHDDFADARQRFAMHDDWMPTAKGWKATAVRNGLANTPFNPEALLEFRSYWINRPDKHQTQGQWEHDLAQSIKRGVRHDQSNPGRFQAQAGARTGRQGSVSAVDKVRNAIAERKAREAAAGAAGQALDEDGGDVRPPLDVEFWRHGRP